MTLYTTMDTSAHCHMAQHELHSLGQGRQLLENVVSTINLNVLKERFRCSDIFPTVTLELARKRDWNNSQRILLGFDIAQELEANLQELCTGDAQDSNLVLQVNVTVVSNGRRRARPQLFNGVFGSTTETAKLTASYCLYCRETGAVAVTKQLSVRQECSNDSDDVFAQMQEQICSTILREVSFTCCSRIPYWQRTATSLLQSGAIISTKPKGTYEKLPSIAETESSCSSSNDDADYL